MENIKDVKDIFGDDIICSETKERDDIIDKRMIIIDMQEREGEFGKYQIVKAKFADDDIEFTFLHSWQVVMDKILKLKEGGYLPCFGTIQKQGKYYNIV